jgi:Flp pilus assembly protein TadB
MITGRLKAFTANFPDAIELMVRGLRSGLPITETLTIVSGEISGPVGAEFRAVSDRMKIGLTMDAALQETADRLGTPEFQFFVITLAIQRETGGNLAETLSNLADVLRKRAQMKLKIKAMSSEAKASAMIVGALPFIVFTLVYLLNPDYMGGFFTDERLIVAGLGAMVWMGIGVAIMAKWSISRSKGRQGTMEPSVSSGPTLLGVDVIWVATLLTAIATLAVITAIYAATTVRDPMARRVKALNERREQLKAGIVASTNRRKSLVNKNQAADKVRGILSTFKMVQDSQLKDIQTKLLQAGIRTKDLAFFIIFGRLIMPVVLGGAAIVAVYVFDSFPNGARSRNTLWSRHADRLLQGADLWLKNRSTSAVTRSARASRRLDLLVICAEAGLPSTPRSGGSRATRQGLSRTRGRIRPDLDRARVPQRAAAGIRQSCQPVELEAVRGVVTTMIQTEKYGTPLAFGAARIVGRVPQRAHDASRGEGRALARDHDRSADPVHSSGPVCRHSRAGGLLHQRQHDRRRLRPRTQKWGTRRRPVGNHRPPFVVLIVTQPHSCQGHAHDDLHH